MLKKRCTKKILLTTRLKELKKRWKKCVLANIFQKLTVVLQKLARLRLSFKKRMLLGTTFKHLQKRWKNCVLATICQKLAIVLQKLAR